MSSSITARKIETPFPGLRPFLEEESELFFGQEGRSNEVISILSRRRFVAVVGNSGSGKSSLLRAGVLPALRSGLLAEAGPRWQVVDMRPRNDPFANLSFALAAAGFTNGTSPDDLRTNPCAAVDSIRSTFDSKPALTANVFLLVDQFEELFRFTAKHESLTADYDEKAAFVSLLLTTAAHPLSSSPSASIYVMITMRSDYLGDCSQFRELPETMNQAQFLVPRMTRDQLRRAIEGPIGIVGGAISPRLVQRLLNEVDEDSDYLPLLQHTLMRSWQHCTASGSACAEITEDDYEKIGTMENALSKHADEAYDDAKPVNGDGEQVVKGVFQRLRERDARGHETRRPTSIKELRAVTSSTTKETTLKEITDVIECFRRHGRTFLTPFDVPLKDLNDTTEIDVTHECLLRKWQRLAGDWVREEEESRRIYLQLAGRSEDDPLTGAILDRALEWWDQRQPNRSWAERYNPDFEHAETVLRLSKERRDKEQEKQEADRRAEEQHKIEEVRRQEAKQKHLAYIFAAILLVVFGGSYLYSALGQQAKLARARQFLNQAIVQGQDERRLPTSALLTAESLRLEPGSSIAKDWLQKAIGGLPVRLDLWPGVKPRMASYSPDGSAVAVVADDGKDVQLLDRSSGTISAHLPHPAEVKSLVFVSGAVITGADDGNVRLWQTDSTDGNPQVLSCGTQPVTMVAAASDGSVVACASSKGDGNLPVVLGWRISKKPARTRRWSVDLATDQGQPGHSPTDSTTDTTSSQPTCGHSNQILPRALFDGTEPITSLSLNSIGNRMIVTQRSVARVFDTGETGRVTTIDSDTASITARFSSNDANTFYYGEGDGTVGWCDLSTNGNAVLFKLHSAVKTLAMATNGRQLAVAGVDGLVNIWDVTAASVIAKLYLSGPPVSLAVTPENEEVIAFDTAGAHRYQLGNLVLRAFNTSSRFAPDGGTLVLRQGAKFTIVKIKKGSADPKERPAGSLHPLALSSDGRRAFVAGKGHYGVADLNATDLGAFACTVEPAPQIYTGTAFSSHDHYVATVIVRSQNPEDIRGLIVWSTENCKRVAVSSELPISAFAFTPDEKSVLFIHSAKIMKMELPDGAITQVDVDATSASTLSISPNGALLAIANNPPSSNIGQPSSSQVAPAVRVFRWPSLQEEKKLQFNAPVRLLSFSTDSNRLLTTTTDRETQVWDRSDWSELAGFSSSAQPTAAALTPAGEVAVVTRDGVSLYSPRPLIDDLCSRVERNVAPDQWTKLMPGEKWHKTCDKLP